MNEFWTTILGSIARTTAATAGGYAVAKGTISADQLTQVAGAAGIAATGIWSIWQKIRARK
jgi:hypothetical protein